VLRLLLDRMVFGLNNNKAIVVLGIPMFVALLLGWQAQTPDTVPLPDASTFEDLENPGLELLQKKASKNVVTLEDNENLDQCKKVAGGGCECKKVAGGGRRVLVKGTVVYKWQEWLCKTKYGLAKVLL
jgi:hypothetical protein